MRRTKFLQAVDDSVVAAAVVVVVGLDKVVGARRRNSRLETSVVVVVASIVVVDAVAVGLPNSVDRAAQLVGLVAPRVGLVAPQLVVADSYFPDDAAAADSVSPDIFPQHWAAMLLLSVHGGGGAMLLSDVHSEWQEEEQTR